MTINRHNYETFFLLYVDNELSATERKAVEQFVEENIDLKPELQSLLKTTLPSETISFSAKNGLYKNEVDQDLLQENLLLHLDNELDPAASQKMEDLVGSNNSFLTEWKILQQTKLDATEKIVFENKHVLYRHEKGRVVTMRFWKIAVAAAILFACLFTAISLLKKEGPVKDVAEKKMIKPSTEKQINSNNGSDKNAVDPLQTNVSETIASLKEKEQQSNKATTPVINSNAVSGKKEITSNNQLVKEEKNTSEKTSLENINKEKSNETIASIVIDKNKETISTDKLPVEIANKSEREKITTPDNPIIDYNSIPAKPDSYAKTAVLDESAPGSNSKILYMNEENVARSKIGGLFRRVKRVIERNTNIKTGNGVKIAGFEIAVK